MTTPVRGPGDVQPGDLVEVSASWKGNERTGVATVVKATDSKLTVRWPDGSMSCRMYTRTEVSTDFRRTRSTVCNFDKMNAHERWARVDRPRLADVVNVTSHGRGESFGASADTIRDRLPDVVAQLEVIAAWLKSEPAKES